MEKLKTAISNFKKVQDKYKSDGATDTEPDWYWQHRIRLCLKGEIPENPSLDEWDTYTPEANKALEKAFLPIQEILKEYGEIREYLSALCWRINL